MTLLSVAHDRVNDLVNKMQLPCLHAPRTRSVVGRAHLSIEKMMSRTSGCRPSECSASRLLDHRLPERTSCVVGHLTEYMKRLEPDAQTLLSTRAFAKQMRLRSAQLRAPSLREACSDVTRMHGSCFARLRRSGCSVAEAMPASAALPTSSTCRFTIFDVPAIRENSGW